MLSTKLFFIASVASVIQAQRYVEPPYPQYNAPPQNHPSRPQEYQEAPRLAYQTKPRAPPRRVEEYPSYEVVPQRKQEYVEAPPSTTTTTTTTTTTEKPVPKTVDATAYNYPERDLPLGGCFYNGHGFACCDKRLQNSMEEFANKLLNNGTFHRCNVQKLANDLQKTCESVFGDDFETVVGIGDYAERIHFRKTLVCKIEVHGRYMLAYATPTERPSSLRIKRHHGNISDIHEYNY